MMVLFDPFKDFPMGAEMRLPISYRNETRAVLPSNKLSDIHTSAPIHH